MKNGNKSDKPKRPPFHEEFAEKIIERLKEGTAPWQQPWHPGKTIAAPHNPASGTVYRGMNRVHLALSGYDDPRWMTLRQANEKDMRIIPGSKATPVVYFQFSKEQDRVGEDGKPVLGEDGKPEKMTVELDKPIMRFARVFNAEQIEGMPPLELTDKAFEWEPVEKAENILSASGANINHDQSNRAFYRYGTDSIHLPPRENFEEPGLYYGTALHELGHWTRHSSRLDRENGPFGSEMYAKEELRAEIASWMLGQDIGIPHDPEHHASYVNSWVKALEDDPYEIVRACRDAEQIKEYILGLEMKKELAQEQAVRPERNVERDEGIAAMGVPANPAKEKTFLAVPYKEKEQAKKLGAKWDKDNKLWFAPEGTDLNQLSAWLPEKAIAPEPKITMPPQEEFSRALEQFGLDLDGKEPIMDGQIHRVPIIGKSRGDLDGAYCGFLDERPAGWMQDFSAGEKHTWAASDHTLTKEQLAVQRAEIARKREERQQAIIERQHSAARDAHAEWIGHDWATAENAYLQKKGVPPLGVREDLDGNLMVPAQNVEGDLRGLQYISPEGQKRFQSGMEKNGNYHLIAEPGKDLSQGEILLAEGYATGASLHMATEKPVAVAFDAGNLEPVAIKLRKKFPNAAITICADNDHQHTRKTPEGTELWNKGVDLAQKAAQVVGGKVVAPIFNEEERARGLTDFNDLHQSRGLDEVKKQVGLVLQQATDKSRDKGKTRELAL
ncbi:MAG: zincin-like metallopeptidase domain-containing protein [Syntrophotalea acetylenica]|nr:zincin-like metallopeptidase domain-containing protein [Syntrophotalea acetylenica]